MVKMLLVLFAPLFNPFTVAYGVTQLLPDELVEVAKKMYKSI